MATITLVLIEDHPIFREGLLRVISRDSRFRVVGEADDGLAGVNLIQELLPDIAVVDINLPKLDGLELANRLYQNQIKTRVVMLTMHRDEEFFHKAMKARVSGYVLKENAAPELLKCLTTVADSQSYISPVLSHHLVKRINAADQLRQTQPGLRDLTRMELHILKLLAANKSSKDIAAELSISPHTVHTHRKNISTKLNLRGAHSLLQFAIENKGKLI